jgi:hypothetical protein
MMHLPNLKTETKQIHQNGNKIVKIFRYFNIILEFVASDLTLIDYQEYIYLNFMFLVRHKIGIWTSGFENAISQPTMLCVKCVGLLGQWRRQTIFISWAIERKKKVKNKSAAA